MKTNAFIIFLVCRTLIGFSQTDSQSGFANFDEEKEKSAILATFTAETENFFKRDYEGTIKFFISDEYLFHAWNNPDGTFNATVGWSALSEKYKNHFHNNPVVPGTSNHPRVERRNMTFKFFSPEVAFVIWDQYNSDKEMKNFKFSKETRIMEKQNGLWKIANMTAFWDYKNIIPVDSLK
jgi:hypothetical protein